MPNFPNWVQTILLALLLGVLANYLTPLPKFILMLIRRAILSVLVVMSKRFTRRRIRLLKERLDQLQNYQKSFEVMHISMLRRLLNIVFYGFTAVLMTGVAIAYLIPIKEGKRLSDNILLVLLVAAMLAYTRFTVLVVKASDDLRDVLNYDTYKMRHDKEIQTLENRLTR